MTNLEVDRKLVKRCIEKDRKAQFELYEKFKVKMFGLCLRYAKDEAQAHDFLQEGFINVFNCLHQYRGEGSLRKWIERVFVNRMISILRKKKITFDSNIELERLPSPQVIKFDEEEKKVDRVIALIQQLPEGYQAVFNLYAIEGYSHEEIASILNIKESTSRSQYFRAKKAIKKALEKFKSVES